MENYILRKSKGLSVFLENKKIFIDPDDEQLQATWVPAASRPLHPDITAWLIRRFGNPGHQTF